MWAYRYGLSVASHYGAMLLVQHVVELWRHPCAEFTTSPGQYDKFCRALCGKGEMELQQLMKRYQRSDVRAERIVQQGMVPDSILASAEEQKVDLIVMGTHGRRGLDRLMLGSATEQVMRKHCAQF